ncbi:glycoside hydrolase superfamily [Phlyctochytrium arcticum]|nr:glycoside hydrolase superfamily [Phlyctochytrium arcticum]
MSAATRRGFTAVLAVTATLFGLSSAAPQLAAYYRPVTPGSGLAQLSEYDGSLFSTLIYGGAMVSEDAGVYWGNVTHDTKAIIGDFEPACDCCAFGGIGELVVFKLRNQHVRTELAFGGNAGKSRGLAVVAANPVTREGFARNATTLMQSTGLQGIHIDWQWPENANDWNNFAPLLKSIRDVWAEINSPMGYTLSVSLPATDIGTFGGSQAIAQAIAQYATQIHLLPYRETAAQVTQYVDNTRNAAGDPVPDSLDAALTAYGTSLPMDRTLFGVNTMADVFNDVTPGAQAPGKNDTGVYSAFKARNRDALTYRGVVATERATPSAGYTSQFDAARGASSLFNPSTNTLIVAQSPDSIRDRATYLQSKNAAGFVFTNLGGDLPSSDSNSLHQVASAALNSGSAVSAGSNTPSLCSENTNYCNLRTCGWIKSDKLVAKKWFLWLGIAAVIVWLIVYYIFGRIMFRCYNFGRIFDRERLMVRKKRKGAEPTTMVANTGDLKSPNSSMGTMAELVNHSPPRDAARYSPPQGLHMVASPSQNNLNAMSYQTGSYSPPNGPQMQQYLQQQAPSAQDQPMMHSNDSQHQVINTDMGEYEYIVADPNRANATQGMAVNGAGVYHQ